MVSSHVSFMELMEMAEVTSVALTNAFHPEESASVATIVSRGLTLREISRVVLLTVILSRDCCFA